MLLIIYAFPNKKALRAKALDTWHLWVTTYRSSIDATAINAAADGMAAEGTAPH